MTIVSLDIETINAEGKADYRWWLPGFKILSIAFSWRGSAGEMKSQFTADPEIIDNWIRGVAKAQTAFVVHNLAFEKGVFETLYPELKFNWHCDTMRLAQLKDNGGDWRDQVFVEDVLDVSSPDLGLGLEAAASRFLHKDLHAHKDERDRYLKTHHKIRSKQGAHIHLLPEELLERYNIADTVITLELYEALAPELDGIWQKDWDFYSTRTHLMNQAQRRGILIVSNALNDYIDQLLDEIDQIEKTFLQFYDDSIKSWSNKMKKETSDFNIGSNKHLKELFCDILGMTGAHLTTKGESVVKKSEMIREQALKSYPSFQSKHLSDWGEGGKILELRRKRLLVLSQALSTRHLALKTGGRVHPEIRVAGTRTNRVAGGSSE